MLLLQVQLGYGPAMSARQRSLAAGVAGSCIHIMQAMIASRVGCWDEEEEKGNSGCFMLVAADLPTRALSLPCSRKTTPKLQEARGEDDQGD